MGNEEVKKNASEKKTEKMEFGCERMKKNASILEKITKK